MRRPAVAGQFYPSSPKDLKRELGRCFSGLAVEVSRVLGAVIPHAGYLYSGSTAAHVYASLPEADTYILLGPNHTGYGSPVAVSSETWITPLGEAEADVDLIKALPKGIIDLDEVAHRHEHSLEVQLPFLQHRFKHRFKIMPICLGLQDEDTSKEVGIEMAEAVKKLNRRVVIIASSDFTHYRPAALAREVDHYVIEPILKLDVMEFYMRVREKHASVCGYGAIAAMLTAASSLGASRGTLLKYSNSGDIIGDMSSVVGYAGIIVE